MKTLARMVALPVTLLVLPVWARPADDGVASAADPYYAEPAAEEAMPPPSPPPAESPPPPPSEVPAPPAQVQAAPAPPGQWIYTQQYGWVWMPYDDGYTHVPASGYGQPYAYVYYPVYGWTWLAAPWVWGVGPWPYFGVYGAWRFAWYGHGWWWRHPGRWHSAPAFRGGFPRGAVVRPVPRSGSAYSAGTAAPYQRGGAVYRSGVVGRGAVGHPGGGAGPRSGGGHGGDGRGGGGGRGGGRR